jgi:hypothetical protein
MSGYISCLVTSEHTQPTTETNDNHDDEDEEDEEDEDLEPPVVREPEPDE